MNNVKTSYQLCKQEYIKLCKEFGSHSIDIAIGDLKAYYKYVWKDNLQRDFIEMLNAPCHDWQADC